MLVGGVAGVEAVGAVGIEGQPGDRGVERVAQRRSLAIVDVAIVAGDRAGDDGILADCVASSTATGASLVPVTVMVSEAVPVAPWASVTV